LKIENPWRGVGVAYRAALERLCRARPYRGFESRPLRSAILNGSIPKKFGKMSYKLTVDKKLFAG
jgi:hypothetical protein